MTTDLTFSHARSRAFQLLKEHDSRLRELWAEIVQTAYRWVESLDPKSEHRPQHRELTNSMGNLMDKIRSRGEQKALIAMALALPPTAAIVWEFFIRRSYMECYHESVWGMIKSQRPLIKFPVPDLFPEIDIGRTLLKAGLFGGLPEMTFPADQRQALVESLLEAEK